MHDTSVGNLLLNGKMNGIGILARDENGEFVWGLMGPLKDVNVFESQLWANHFAMKYAYLKDYPSVIIETDNTAAFGVLSRNDQEKLEVEEVTTVVR